MHYFIDELKTPMEIIFLFFGAGIVGLLWLYFYTESRKRYIALLEKRHPDIYEDLMEKSGANSSSFYGPNWHLSNYLVFHRPHSSLKDKNLAKSLLLFQILGWLPAVIGLGALVIPLTLAFIKA